MFPVLSVCRNVYHFILIACLQKDFNDIIIKLFYFCVLVKHELLKDYKYNIFL